MWIGTVQYSAVQYGPKFEVVVSVTVSRSPTEGQNMMMITASQLQCSTGQGTGFCLHLRAIKRMLVTSDMHSSNYCLSDRA